MDEKTIGNWGGNPALRLNGMMMKEISKLAVGEKVIVTYQKNKIIIEAVKK